jgi:hypothetical protein
LNTKLQQVVYEQYWPWELLHEQAIDSADIMSGTSRQANPEIAWLLDQGYQPRISVYEQIAENYTTVTYLFDLDAQTVTWLMLKFPEPVVSYNV